MTWSRTSADTFAADSLAGFVAAFGDSVRAVDGGVVLRARKPGQVAVVVGGGSGHYPAFAGMVGPGLASAAVCGEIFASPSAGQVYRVTQAAETGAGALLLYGNYMGDVLNFSHAQEKLRAGGMDVRTVRVTDDVVSAPAEEKHKRRGVAGDLFVFKIAGAAAARGQSLDQVEAVAAKANDSVYSFGVAFDGCTLPGSEKPLFSVPEGMMSLGLGVHGEPGIGETDRPDPAGVAAALVSRVLEEPAPSDSKRVTVLLNGLGTMKYEELFVIYSHVSHMLADKGFDIIRPEVGELVTSLDMGGCSLTIAWLDDELEELWAAPCDAPGFRRSVRDSSTTELSEEPVAETSGKKNFVEPANSVEIGSRLRPIFQAIAEQMGAMETELGDLDAKTGDGDHGIGMARGSRGAAEALAASDAQGAVELLSIAAEGWSESGGGTSGAIWGILLGSIASSLSRAPHITAEAVAHAMVESSRTVQDIGGAKVGDKTLVDALEPFAASLSAAVTAGDSLHEAWIAASAKASEAAAQTAELTPQIGRAKTHGQKGVGIPDAGAVSLARITVTVSDHLTEGQSA